MSKLGVVVCEDFWNDKTFWKERLYESDPTDEVIAMGADIIVSINASPYNKGKIKLRCDMVAHRAKLQKKPIVFVNLVGGNDGIIFDGASLIADEEGDIILQATAFEEFVETVELDVRKPDARGITGNEIESIRQALVLGIRDYARKNGFTKGRSRAFRRHRFDARRGARGRGDRAGKSALRDDAVAVLVRGQYQGLAKNWFAISAARAASNRSPTRLRFLLKQMNLHKPTKGGEASRQRICSRGFAASS